MGKRQQIVLQNGSEKRQSRGSHALFFLPQLGFVVASTPISMSRYTLKSATTFRFSVLQ